MFEGCRYQSADEVEAVEKEMANESDDSVRYSEDDFEVRQNDREKLITVGE